MLANYLWAARTYPVATAFITVLVLLGLTFNVFMAVAG